MITSRANPTIKRIRALRSRRDRDESGLFFVEGIRIVGEAAEAGAPIDTLVVAPELLTSAYARDLVARLQHHTQVLDVSADVFQSISVKEGPQGIGAVLRQRWSTLEDTDPADDFCWVALDGVQDPGNLGTILRTCDAVGASGIILLGATTDPYDPTALRASMGAIFFQRLTRSTFEACLDWARQHAVMSVATADSADKDYRSVEYASPLLLVMGSEQKGLSRQQQAACDVGVRIPMVGHSDSLNLSVATGVMLYELLARVAARGTSSA